MMISNTDGFGVDALPKCMPRRCLRRPHVLMSVG